MDRKTSRPRASRRASLALLLVAAATVGQLAERPAGAQSPASAGTPLPPPPPISPRRFTIEFTTLDIMRQKGIITQAEYDSAIRDLTESVGHQAGEQLSLVLGKWSATMYGFAQADFIYDTTESFSDQAANAQIARGDTYQGTHGRFTAGVRNSRLGFRLRAPEFHKVRVSAVLEMDFLGNQAPGTSEGATFTNPTFRMRHYMMRIETPVLDVLVGQWWQLFGFQSNYHPNTVEIQGTYGHVYGRTPQLRLSKTITTKHVQLEIAAAMVRSPQRDSAVPEGQGGVRIAFPDWRGRQTTGATGTSTSPLSFAVTADVRHFELAEFSAAPKLSVPKTGWGIAADGFVPLIPASLLNKVGSLSVVGEYAWGLGTADLYSGLTGGVTNPALPNPSMATPAPTYTPNLDAGMVVFDAAGGAHLIQWQSYIIGAQYYVPKLDGRLWLAGNYSHLSSSNAGLHGRASATRKSSDWFDVLVMSDVLPSVRLGLEYAWFADTYTDGMQPINHRIQFSAFYIF